MGSLHRCAGCGSVHAASIACGHGHDELLDIDTATDLELLHALEDLREERASIDDDERRCVERLRALGVSWAKIAYRLDVSKTSLLRSYSYLS